MPKLEVTALTNTVAIQDDFPSEGLLAMTVKVGTPVTKTITAGQLQRLSEKLQAMEAAGRITYRVLATDGDARGDIPNLPGSPEIHGITSGDYVALAGDTGVVVAGENFLSGQTKAAATLGSSADNSSIEFTAVVPGAAGNDISVEFADGEALAVEVDGNAITVTLNTETTTYADIETAILSNSDASALVNPVKDGTGLGAATVTAATNLSGGTGAGITAELEGTACTITATTASTITLTTPDLSGSNPKLRSAALVFRIGAQVSTLNVPLKYSTTPAVHGLNALNAVAYDGSSDVAVDGEALLTGQAKASLVVGDEETDNGFITFTSVLPGSAGNDITVEFATGGALAVEVDGDAITVTLNTGTSTYSDIETAVNADGDASALVLAAKDGTGAETAAVAEAAALTGGSGSGFTAELEGAACTISAVTDTQITLTTPDVSSNTASRIAALAVYAGDYVSVLDVPVTGAE